MKKLTSLIAILLVAAIVATALLVRGRASVPDSPDAAQVALILKQNACFMCHSENPDLPFYSEWPVIGPKMEEHVRHAVRFTNLEASVNEDIDDVTLSMLSHAATYRSMPPTGFRLVHWGSGLNQAERRAIAGWVNGKRGSEEPVATIPPTVDFDVAKAELGERMFNDARISLDGTITCATCHVLEDGGADHADERVSEGIDGLKGGVNAPTVYNAGFNVRQFWNGRAADLREQAEGPATNPVEMGDQSWDQIVGRLSEDKELVAEFETLYPGEGLTRMSVTDAIAEFEKTLVTPDSRFDRHLNGDGEAMTVLELDGYDKFKENACATCHTGVILGGRSFEHLDIYGDYFGDRSPEIEYNSDDDGLKGFTGNEGDLHKFKVPGLRNVALTAPYFHDGTQQTLEDATRAMAKYEMGRELPEKEVESIVAFLHTLTGQNPHLKP